MTSDLTIDLIREFGRIIADECNVKKVTFNGVVIHEEPLLKDKYKDKQAQFDKIYNEK